MRVAIYTGKRIDEKANTSQVVQLTYFAQMKAWDYEVFSEVTKQTDLQPVKEEVLIRLQRNEFGAVLVYRLGDWSFTSVELVEEINMLKSRGKRFISLHENFDTSTLTGELYLKVLSDFAELDQTYITKTEKKSSSREDITDQKSNVFPDSVYEQVSKFKKSPTLINNKSDFDLVDMNGAVLLTGYSKHALYSMTCRHEIPFNKRPGGRKVFFSKSALQEWIMNGPDNRNLNRRSYSS
jgi:predicted DNA-binding transcriptional regulator AlpA